MSRLTVFLAFSVLLVVRLECAEKTYFSAPYVLYCDGPFTYTATLFEHDDFGNDIIGSITDRTAADEAAGNLTGYQKSDGPLDKEYEIFIRIEHTCEDKGLRVADRWLKVPECKVGAVECIYPEQMWDL